MTVGHLKPSKYFERVLNNVPTAPIGGFRENADGIVDSKVSVVNTKADLHFPGSGPMRYYDKMLRKFEHSKALTNVMKEGE